MRPDDVATAVAAQLLPEVTEQIDERLDELGQQLAGRLAAVTADMRRRSGRGGTPQLAETAATPPETAPPLPLVPPRPSADAPQVWEVRPGQTLADVLYAWAQQARCHGQAGSGTWTVVYESPFAYPVAAGARLNAADLPDAVEQLISGFDAAVRADVYRGNCVVRVTAGGAG